MSAPAMNVRPPPISTTALTPSSWPTCAIVCAIAFATPGLKAFTGGLLMVIIAMSLSLVSCTGSSMALNSLSGIFKGSLAHRKFVRLAFLSAPILFAQSFFQNFSGSSLGQALQELDRPRALEVRNTRAAEFDQVRFRWF